MKRNEEPGMRRSRAKQSLSVLNLRSSWVSGLGEHLPSQTGIRPSARWPGWWLCPVVSGARPWAGAGTAVPAGAPAAAPPPPAPAPPARLSWETRLGAELRVPERHRPDGSVPSQLTSPVRTRGTRGASLERALGLGPVGPTEPSEGTTALGPPVLAPRAIGGWGQALVPAKECQG